MDSVFQVSEMERLKNQQRVGKYYCILKIVMFDEIQGKCNCLDFSCKNGSVIWQSQFGSVIVSKEVKAETAFSPSLEPSVYI